MSADMIRWVNSLFLPVCDTCRDTCWHPLADVYRTRQGWLIKFDLAGVRPEDVQVSVSGRRLRVQGVRRDWCAEEGCRSYLLEISYSEFDRTLELPFDLEPAHIEMEYREGMLLVRVAS